MKITHVICQVLRIDSSESRAGQDQEMALIRVRTDSGLEGVGHAGAPAEVVKAIVDLPGSPSLRDLLVGENPLEIERLWRKLRDGMRAHRQDAMILSTLAGIDIALWDLKGRHLGEPIHRLLGGKYQEQMPVCASASFGADAIETQSIARRWTKEGMTALRLEWDASQPERDLERDLIAAARQGLGERATLVVDAGAAWDARTALAYAESFRDLNLGWLEQPVRANDPDALGWLRDRSPLPVAGGRHAAGREGFKPLLDRKALDIYQVDVTRCGFTDAAFLRARVQEAGAGIINSPGISAIAVAAGLHWLATCPDASLFADFAEDSLLRNDLTRERLQPEDGALTVPDAPGLGVTLNEDFVRQYLVAESGA